MPSVHLQLNQVRCMIEAACNERFNKTENNFIFEILLVYALIKFKAKSNRFVDLIILKETIWKFLLRLL